MTTVIDLINESEFAFAAKAALIDAIKRKKEELKAEGEEFKNTSKFAVDFYLNFDDEIEAVCEFNTNNTHLTHMYCMNAEKEVQALYDLNLDDEYTIELIENIVDLHQDFEIDRKNDRILSEEQEKNFIE